MIVGIAEIDLFIGEAHSLKEKRMVLNRIKDRVKHKFNASIAEVDAQDSWQRAVMGLAVVSTSGRHAESMLTTIINFIERDGRCDITNVVQEFV